MNNYKLTIVTVVFNDADNIVRTIESVLKHKTDKIEYIVIDGASTDGTRDKIYAYQPKLDSFISEKDNGIYDAMNKGLEMATGDAVIFMNSGDIFAEDLDLNALIDKHDLISEIIIGFSIQTYKGDSYLRPSRSNIKHLINYPAHQAIFVPRKCYKAVSFKSDLKIAADYYWIKDVLKIADYKIEENVISIFSLGGKSTSSKFVDIYQLFKEMNVRFCLMKSIIKFILFNVLGRRKAFRLIYKDNYTRL